MRFHSPAAIRETAWRIQSRALVAGCIGLALAIVIGLTVAPIAAAALAAASSTAFGVSAGAWLVAEQFA